MGIRRFNIKHLLQNGGRLNPFDIIIDYRLVRSISNEVIVSVYSTSNDNGILLLGREYLFKPTVLEFNTDIFQVVPKIGTGIWVEFENAESVEIKRVEAVYNESTKLSGRKMSLGVLAPVITIAYMATITAETGNDIYITYTNNGTIPLDPTIDDEPYSNPITPTEKFNLKAIAHNGTSYSSVTNVSWI